MSEPEKLRDMEQYGMTRENLLRSLPLALAGDPKTAALAQVIAGALERRKEEISQVAVYPNIHSLPGDLLDILARDFKVDWWDGDYTLEEKRRTLEGSWQVHRTLGTKAAVETALSAVYPDTLVQEWFEYEGEPYRFKLLIDVTYQNVDPEKHRAVLKRVAFYKNLRSWLDQVEYYAVSVEAPTYSGAGYAGAELADGCVAYQY